MIFARLENGLVVEYPLRLSDLQQQMPLVAWSSDPTPEALADKPYVRVTEVPQPALAWGETVEEGPPELVGAEWQQTWIVTPMTLAAAKALLAEKAIALYWRKMLEEPPVAELQAEALSFIGVITEREARFVPVLADVRTRIIAATTVAEARAIYLELEAIA